MARSYWKKSLVTTLAWAGLAWSQSPVPSPGPVPAAAPTERTLTVREEGRAPQKCRLVKAWRTPEGLKAYQVQAVETAEMITIVEGAALPGSGAAASMRIYHWGQGNAPPQGAPVAPERPAVVQTPATPKPVPVPAPAPPKPAVAQLPAPPKPAVAPSQPAPTPIAPITSPYAQRPMPAAKPPTATVAQGTAPKPVTSEPVPPPPPPSGSGLRAVSPPSTIVSSTPVAGSHPVVVTPSPTPAASGTKAVVSAPPAQAPAQPAGTSWWTQPAPVVTKTPAPATPQSAPVVTKAPVYATPESLRDVRAHGLPTNREKESVVAEAKPSETKPVSTIPVVPESVPAKVVSTEKKEKKVEFVSAPAADWRKSWGTADDTSTGPAKVASTPAALASKTVADPLQKVELYTKPVVTPPSVVPSLGDKVTAMPAPPMKASPSAMVKAEPQVVVHVPEGSGAPLGIQSVLAASAGNPAAITQLPVPMVTVPPVRHPVPPLTAPAAPPVVHEDSVNAFTPPVMGIPVMPVPPASEAVANAFSPTQGAASVAPSSQPVRTPNANVTRAGYMDRRQPSGTPMPAPVSVPSSKSPQEMLTSLREALAPSEREWAAEGLSRLDAKANPEAVPALLTAAREDPAILVRLSCIRGLVRLKANTPQVFRALDALKTDADARVRQEAEQAMSNLAAYGMTTDRRVR